MQPPFVMTFDVAQRQRDNRFMATEEIHVRQQKTVDFEGDTLLAVQDESGDIYVPLRHLCDAIGVSRQGQMQRIRRSDVLRDGFRQGIVAYEGGERGGGEQMTSLLRADLVPLWLAGISTRAIQDEAAREKIKQYQRRAAKVLWEAFQEGRLTRDLPATADASALQALEMAEAVYKLARSHVQLTSRVDVHEERLEDFGDRLEAIESALSGQQTVTEEQASQISQAVKAVAVALGKATKSNQFGAVYGELYRRFGITSYKLLPARRFEEAMRFLTEWHQSVVGDEPF